MSTNPSEPEPEAEAEPGPEAPPTRRSAAARWAKGVLQAAGATLLFGAVLELLVTIALGPQVRFPRHVVDGGFGVRINEPGAVYHHRSADVDVEFRINARGLRADRDYPYEKPDGVRRIVAVGDSFTAGYEVQVEDCFASVLERELRARGHQVEVLNAGVSGYGDAEACLYLERELLKYDPDVVLLSFFNNDLVDNVRSNLFALDDGKLVPAADSYVPLGAFGDFLNTSAVFNFLSERSNAFALIKERVTKLLKQEAVEENERNLTVEAEVVDEHKVYQRRLAARIVERILADCRERGIALVVQSIPLWRPEPPGRSGPGALIDVFPTDELDVRRRGLWYVPATSFLEPHLEDELLYHLRSHMHWTPFSHRLSGEALAALIDEEGLLD